jgi:hypothetical protein
VAVEGFQGLGIKFVIDGIQKIFHLIRIWAWERGLAGLAHRLKISRIRLGGQIIPTDELDFCGTMDCNGKAYIALTNLPLVS